MLDGLDAWDRANALYLSLLLLAAAARARGVGVALAFPDHAAGQRLADEARAQGLSAQVVAEDGWPAALAGARLVHVHAGIGWEGHGLTHAATEAGAAVVRTECVATGVSADGSGFTSMTGMPYWRV